MILILISGIFIDAPIITTSAVTEALVSQVLLCSLTTVFICIFTMDSDQISLSTLA